jgi:prenyltransferase beta subunit
LAADEGLPAGLESSVSKGLNFLAQQQDPEGFFDGGGSSKILTTARAVLAFLGSGNVPDVGKYGLKVRQALEWLLSQQTSQGGFGTLRQRGMRGHGMATLALAQAYGVDTNSERRVRIRAALEKAVAVILAAQQVAKSNSSYDGGWNDVPDSADSTLSVTLMQLLALRSCQDIGLTVPGQSFKSAGEFVLRCHDSGGGGFGPAPGRGPQLASTAAAMVCLRLLDPTAERLRQLEAGAKFVASRPIDDNAPIGYASVNVVTLCTFGTGGAAWSGVGRNVVARLIRMQEKDGGWPVIPVAAGAARTSNRTSATAAALQALTTPYQLMPIYQR